MAKFLRSWGAYKEASAIKDAYLIATAAVVIVASGLGLTWNELAVFHGLLVVTFALGVFVFVLLVLANLAERYGLIDRVPVTPRSKMSGSLADQPLGQIHHRGMWWSGVRRADGSIYVIGPDCGKDGSPLEIPTPNRFGFVPITDETILTILSVPTCPTCHDAKQMGVLMSAYKVSDIRNEVRERLATRTETPKRWGVV